MNVRARVPGGFVPGGFVLAGLVLACAASVADAGSSLRGVSLGEPAPYEPRSLASVDEDGSAAVRANPELAARDAAVPDTLTAADARAALARALDFLVRTQNADGSFGTPTIEGLWDSHYALESYYAWQYAGVALAAYGLALAPETPERRRALERAVEWLVTTRFPKRPSDWDNDTMWAAVYGLVTCVHVADDPRFASDAWRTRLAARGRDCAAFLVATQVPEGGWGYYDDPPFTARPKWATSFSTAAVLPAFARARELGWLAAIDDASTAGGPGRDDTALVRRARDYVRRCALPNGAYAYDLRPISRFGGGEHIDGVKGSLGRIQVCNWALARVGERSITSDKLEIGLATFFEEHRFLDVARMRPVPHEAYYANAGYFYYFGHLYAAKAIELLPVESRESFHARLRPHVVKTQRTDGSFCDYQSQSYNVAACTGMAAAALALGLPEGRR
ncbi:MAG: hypothetical protein L6Q99_00835 [Planctomycetes bacterium]|nr:hypothetical protein [Planctomycetota bacterium]